MSNSLLAVVVVKAPDLCVGEAIEVDTWEDAYDVAIRLITEEYESYKFKLTETRLKAIRKHIEQHDYYQYFGTNETAKAPPRAVQIIQIEGQ